MSCNCERCQKEREIERQGFISRVQELYGWRADVGCEEIMKEFRIESASVRAG